MNDIVIDNMVAKIFTNPLDPEYKKLIEWLINEGCLAVCNYLITEYNRTSQNSNSDKNICVIIHKLTINGRLNKFSNEQLKLLKFPKKQTKINRSHAKDIPILKTVILSDRNYCITLEEKLIHDINNYPGLSSIAVKRPQDINY